MVAVTGWAPLRLWILFKQTAAEFPVMTTTKGAWLMTMAMWKGFFAFSALAMRCPD